MAPTDAEKRRARRANKPKACRDREKESSRTRMAVCRARNKARERASLLRKVLGEGDRAALAARADEEKQRLICDWLRRNKLLRFSPQVRIEDKMLKSFMKKVDLHRIELQVAEFEIAMMLVWMEDSEGRSIASVLDDKGKERTTANSHKYKNRIERFSEKEMATSDIYGNEVREIGGVKQEDITKRGYSGTNGRGLSERNEDEILAAEAMAIMQYA